MTAIGDRPANRDDLTSILLTMWTLQLADYVVGQETMSGNVGKITRTCINLRITSLMKRERKKLVGLRECAASVDIGWMWK